MSETKYGKYFISKPKFEKLAYSVKVPQSEARGKTRSQIYMSNALVEGCNKHIILMGIHEVPYPNPIVEHHSHPYDEILLFLGSDPHNLEDLGGEVEMEMGEEKEKHVFNTTTAVFIPKGLKHCVAYKRVDRPQLLVAISMHGEYL